MLSGGLPILPSSFNNPPLALPSEAVIRVHYVGLPHYRSRKVNGVTWLARHRRRGTVVGRKRRADEHPPDDRGDGGQEALDEPWRQDAAYDSLFGNSQEANEKGKDSRFSKTEPGKFTAESAA